MVPTQETFEDLNLLRVLNTSTTDLFKSSMSLFYRVLLNTNESKDILPLIG